MVFCTIIGKFKFSYNIKAGKSKMKKTKMLKKNYEYRKVLSKGKYYSGSNIEAFILKNNSKYNFLGLAISTKIANAVKRNFIKRLIRENYKMQENSIKTGITIIFLWKKKADIKNATFIKIKEDLISIFDKADILIKEEKI